MPGRHGLVQLYLGTPEQNGVVTAEAVALAERLYDGLLNSKGEQVESGVKPPP